jgi:hypothetical protein
VRVAVVGGGIFGATAAVELLRDGHRVDLYERHKGLLCGASRANQARLHHGYHYPRSPHTAVAARAGAVEFAARYPSVIRGSARHYYAAAEDSPTAAAAFVEFCERLDLPLAGQRPPMLIGRAVQGCWRVPEAFIDIPALRALLHVELRGARVHLGTTVDPDGLDHDVVVEATYGQPWATPLRYETCETVLIKLGPHFAGISLVVLDGAYCSLDPVPGTDLHMLYDVTHSVHHASDKPVAPTQLARLLDKGPVFTRESAVDSMLQTLRRYVRGVGMPEYRGSYFTIRAVLPDVDQTDERPTLVTVDDRTIRVLSGKIDTAVWAARQITASLREAVPVS